MISPTMASVAAVPLTMLTSGEDTEILTELDTADPDTVLPSGGWKVNEPDA
ncbi:hypothetical protein D3C72_2533240 [compost metagenome]